MLIKSLLQQIDLLQSRINKLRPLDGGLLFSLQEKLRAEWTYNSNAIEGNTLTLGETMFFLKEGLTSEGKPLKDFLEAKNHAEAIDGLYEIIKNERKLTEGLIKELHGVLMRSIEFTYAKTPSGQLVHKKFHAGKYKVEPNHVLTISGKIHQYTEPLKVKDEMEKLVNWYQKEKLLHPVEKAAIFHYQFVRIHPFDDGNGRMARLLMNLILMQHNYPPCIIKNIHRKKYLEGLESVDNSKDFSAFICFIGEELLATQEQILSILTVKEMEKEEVAAYANSSDFINVHERESLILRLFQDRKTLSISQIMASFPDFKRPTLKSDLKRLVVLRKIKRSGIGKGVVYSFVE